MTLISHPQGYERKPPVLYAYRLGANAEKAASSNIAKYTLEKLAAYLAIGILTPGKNKLGLDEAAPQVTHTALAGAIDFLVTICV